MGRDFYSLVPFYISVLKQLGLCPSPIFCISESSAWEEGRSTPLAEKSHISFRVDQIMIVL